MNINIEDPKFKVGDKVSFLDYGERIHGTVKEIRQKVTYIYGEKTKGFTGNGWFYDIHVDNKTRTYHYGTFVSISENRLTPYDTKQEWKDKLEKQGVTFDDKKLELSNVYYDTTYTYGGVPIMVKGVSEGEENITVIFKKVKIH